MLLNFNADLTGKKRRSDGDNGIPIFQRAQRFGFGNIDLAFRSLQKQFQIIGIQRIHDAGRNNFDSCCFILSFCRDRVLFFGLYIHLGGYAVFSDLRIFLRFEEKKESIKSILKSEFYYSIQTE